MRMLLENTQALMIDMQFRLFHHINDFENLEIHSLKLIQGLKVLGVPIEVTEQYVKGLGPTLTVFQEALLDRYKPTEKMEFSCIDCSEYARKLQSSNKKQIIVFGIETHVCVMQTALDMIEAGYHPIIIEDCTSSRNHNDKEIAIARLRQAGATITTYEAILFELARVSGTDTFKAISKIVK